MCAPYSQAKELTTIYIISDCGPSSSQEGTHHINDMYNIRERERERERERGIVILNIS